MTRKRRNTSPSLTRTALGAEARELVSRVWE